jgi:hypothetical protein
VQFSERRIWEISFPSGEGLCSWEQTWRILDQSQDVEKKEFSLGLCPTCSEADWNMMCWIQSVGNLLTFPASLQEHGIVDRSEQSVLN